MKKSISALLISIFAFSYAGNVSPTLSLRVVDLLAGDTYSASPVIGLNMELDNGMTSGFDTYTPSGGTSSYSRIHISKSYGKFGLGVITDSAAGSAINGKPYFTIGTTLSNDNGISVGLDYVINRLIETVEDNLQLELTIEF